jgi:hypothetical protein
MTAREEHRLMAFGNRVLRRICGLRGTKWQEVEKHCMMRSFITSRVIRSGGMRWAGHIACMREMRSPYKILVRKPEGNIPFARPRHRWKYNLRSVLTSI